MSITIIDPVVAAAGTPTLGTAVPVGTKRKITKMSAYNGTGAVVTIKVFLTPSGVAASNANCYVDYDLSPRETYMCPEVVGAALNAGGNIQIQGADVTFSAVASDTVNN